jgi:hypothetical protein
MKSDSRRSGPAGGAPLEGLPGAPFANAVAELELMAPVVPRGALGELEDIRAEVTRLFDLVERGVREARIIPGARIRLSAAGAPPRLTRTAVRLGVYPVSADPLHWGHIIDGLSAVARLDLDAVVYVVLDQAADRPTLFSRDLRHEMARRLLERFAPLLVYSPASAGLRHDGPRSLFDLLRLNSRQMIEVCYLAVMDPRSPLRAEAAYRRIMEEMRRLIRDPSAGYSAQRTPLTMGFLGELMDPPPATAPPAVFLPTPFLSVSAAEVVAAMSGSGRPECFARLPYTVYRYILRQRQGLPSAAEAHHQPVRLPHGRPRGLVRSTVTLARGPTVAEDGLSG